MPDLSQIRLQEQDFRTDQTSDWLDGLPLIGLPEFAGSKPGALNAGHADLSVAGVDVGAIEGVHLLTVTSLAGGQTWFSVTDPDGDETGRGAAGLPLYAGGITLTLAQVAGQTALAVDDTFALAINPTKAVDTSGWLFTLQAQLNTRSASVAMQATSSTAGGATPTIINGGAGNLAMRRLRPAMAKTPPGDYPYAIRATDPTTGLTVPAFIGVVRHRALPSLRD